MKRVEFGGMEQPHFEGLQVCSVWERCLPHSTHSKLRESVTADVAVVGGGLLGVATCLWLKLMAFCGSVVLLEAQTLGSGATGRSGGILVVDDEYVAGSSAAFSTLCELLEIIGCKNVIEYPNVSSSRMPDEYNCPVLDPQALIHILSSEAVRRGTRIFEQTRVTEVDETPTSVNLATQTSSVSAKFVVLGTGAYSDKALLDRLDLTVHSEVCIAVSTHDQQLPWTFAKDLDDFGDLAWGRQIGPSRFIFSGGKLFSRSEADLEVMCKRAIEGLAELMPTIESYHVTNIWSGKISKFADGRPWQVDFLPKHRRVMYADGFNGQGLSACVAAGRKIAEEVLKSPFCSRLYASTR